jgi:bZIP-type transcription factor MBZ1
MQVDSQSPLFDFSVSSTSSAAFSGATSFEDFFNFDFSHPGSATSPSSPSSSPRTPRTPPSAYALPPAVADDGISSSFFNLFTEDDFTKASASSQLPPSSSNAPAPYDFLGSLTSLSPFAPSVPSGASNGSPSSDTTSPSAPFAIDPQLVDSPSTAHGGSEFSDDEHDHELDHFDENMQHESPTELAPSKGTTKGKSRKGTVHSGGITKRTPAHRDREGSHMPTSSVVRDPTKEPEEPGDEWRPTPEEYKRMSSKEKRQLRNKISARNFRVRRKGL